MSAKLKLKTRNLIRAAVLCTIATTLTRQTKAALNMLTPASYLAGDISLVVYESLVGSGNEVVLDTS